MADKLVTLAILSYAKAQILRSILQSEGIKVYIHNVNLIQPVVSTGVRVRIAQRDLEKALSIIDKAEWRVEEKEEKCANDLPRILVPVDFSEYSFKACHMAFSAAAKAGAEVILLHVFFTPTYIPALPYPESGPLFLGRDGETIAEAFTREKKKLDTLSEKIKKAVKNGDFPDVAYKCVLREGVPEEEILKFAEKCSPSLIVMGTKGTSREDLNLIGSVAAEVIERSKYSVFAIPGKAPGKSLDNIRRIAFVTQFDQRDILAFDNLMRRIENQNIEISFVHLSSSRNAWNEVKLAGLRDYFQDHYPSLEINYDIIEDDEKLEALEKYVSRKEINVVCITNYRRNIFARLFNPGMARKMIFHTEIPLLIIK